MAFGPDGALYVAQLNGAENAGAGQVVRIAGPGAAPQALIGDLRKPTGLAWQGDALYLAAGRDILRAQRSPAGGLGSPQAIVRELPFNTRSEGQISALPDGRLLFEASGERGDPASGRLLTLDPASGQVRELARGLKNAYAHAVAGGAGQIFTTDIGDDPVDGQPPPEELNLVLSGADYGWPRCYGERRPATNYGGDEAGCARTQAPLLTFPPHSTPTGLAFYAGADFPADYRDSLYVALWNGDQRGVLRVALRAAADGSLAASAAPFLSGIDRPIALLPHPEGGLLVLDFASGTIYRVRAE
jgi:glucose/arabinose dehydrogenase